MASFLDKLQPGSLNGIPFFVDGHNANFGRRIVSHEYPGRDQPFAEDLGRKGRSLSIQAYVINSADNGDDYMADRDRLIAEIEMPGSKRLVHPWLGRMDVVCELLALSESFTAGGMATIDFSFIESGTDALPTSTVSASSATLAEVNVAHRSVISQFASAANYLNSSFLQTHIVDLLGAIDNGFSGLIADLPLPAGLVKDVLSAGESVLLGGNAVTRLMGILNSPTNLVGALVNAASGSTGLLARALSIGYPLLLRASALSNLGVSSHLFGGSPVAAPTVSVAVPAAASSSIYAPRPVTPLRLVKTLEPAVVFPPASYGTPIKDQAAVNQAALKAAADQISAIEQARLSAVLAYPSRDDAKAVRDYISTRLAALAQAADYNMYSQLQTLRVAVIKDLNSRDAASLEAYTANATLSALIVSYNRYGTSLRADEILARNPNIANPALIPGGTILEVLNA